MNVLDLFSQIKTFVFDVDGVLTDGSVLVLEDGQQARSMNTKDGYALQLAIKKGFRIVIISGGMSEAVRMRLNKLGVTDVYMKIEHKKEKLMEYVQQHELKWDEILFMGDDIPDYTSMQAVGLACAPADAVGEIKQISKYISSKKGGEGCARDVIEKVLKLNNSWPLDTDVRSQ